MNKPKFPENKILLESEDISQRFRVYKNKFGFYPQYKKWFWWHNFSKSDVLGNQMSICCQSLDEAINLIHIRIEEAERTHSYKYFSYPNGFPIK